MRLALGCSISAKDDWRDMTDIVIRGVNKLEEGEIRKRTSRL